MSSTKRWRIFCVTEGKFKYTEDSVAPVACYSGGDHVVDTATVKEVTQTGETVNLEQVAEPPSTALPKLGGLVRATTRSYTALRAVDASTPTTTWADFTFPYSIGVINLSRRAQPNEGGNVTSMFVVSNPPFIGTLAAPLAAGSDTFALPAAVCAKLFLGLYIFFQTDMADLNTLFTMGNIVSIDLVANTITCESACPVNLPAGMPIQQAVCPVENVEIVDNYTHAIGDDVIGSTYVSSGTTIRTSYTNFDENTDFRIVTNVEHYY
jgi:hypothetical protein